MTTAPSAFEPSPEDLAAAAEKWDPAEHPHRETSNLLSELGRALRKERQDRASHAEIARQYNLAVGRLEAELDALRRHAAGVETSHDGLVQMALSLQETFARHQRSRISRCAWWIEEALEKRLEAIRARRR